MNDNFGNSVGYFPASSPITSTTQSSYFGAISFGTEAALGSRSLDPLTTVFNADCSISFLLKEQTIKKRLISDPNSLYRCTGPFEDSLGTYLYISGTKKPRGCNRITLNYIPATCPTPTSSITGLSGGTRSITGLSSRTASSVIQTQTIDPCTFVGCFRAGGDPLQGPSLRIDTMSLELCTSFCSGYLYYGLEGGNQCTCSQTLDPSIASARPATCDTPCAGKPIELCGGTNRIDRESTQLFRLRSILMRHLVYVCPNFSSSVGIPMPTSQVPIVNGRVALPSQVSAAVDPLPVLSTSLASLPLIMGSSLRIDPVGSNTQLDVVSTAPPAAKTRFAPPFGNSTMRRAPQSSAYDLSDPTTKETIPERKDPSDPTTSETVPERNDLSDPTTKETVPERNDPSDPTTSETVPERNDPSDPTNSETVPERNDPSNPSTSETIPERNDPSNPTISETIPEGDDPSNPTISETIPEGDDSSDPTNSGTVPERNDPSNPSTSETIPEGDDPLPSDLEYITSTICTTVTSTITMCDPGDHYCTVGQVTTETITFTTTFCPGEEAEESGYSQPPRESYAEPQGSVAGGYYSSEGPSASPENNYNPPAPPSGGYSNSPPAGYAGGQYGANPNSQGASASESNDVMALPEVNDNQVNNGTVNQGQPPVPGALQSGLLAVNTAPPAVQEDFAAQTSGALSAIETASVAGGAAAFQSQGSSSGSVQSPASTLALEQTAGANAVVDQMWVIGLVLGLGLFSVAFLF